MSPSPQNTSSDRVTDSTRRALRRVRRRRPGSVPRRLQVERLEDRLLLSFAPISSPIAVTGSVSDPTGGVGSQQEASSGTVAQVAGGDYLVVWQDAGGIYSRLFSATTGASIGSPVHIGNTSGSADSQPTLAANSSGDAEIAWTHSINGTGGGPSSIELQPCITSATAITPVGVTTAISSAFSSGVAYQPSMSYSGNELVLAYTDANSNGTVQQVKAVEYAGAKQTTVTVTSSTSTSQPSVAVTSTGAFVIAYTQGASPSNQLATGYVEAQQFTAAGAAQGGTFVVGSSNDVENQPSVAYSDGEFVVAYTDVISSMYIEGIGTYVSNRTDVDAVLYNSSGSVLKSIPVWTTTEATNNGYDPLVTMDGSANFVVGYTVGGTFAGYDPSQGSSDVQASPYDATGASTQGAFSLSQGMPGATAGSTNSLPSVALSSTGLLAADWGNLGAGSSGEEQASGVFTQAFLSNPSFTSTLPDGVHINLLGGVPTTIQVDITRASGFNGAISLGISNLPPGVSMSVSPDSTATNDDRTIKFTSQDNVEPQVGFFTTINVSGAETDESPTVQFSVTPSKITSASTPIGGAAAPQGDSLQPGAEALIDGEGFVNVSGVQFGTSGPVVTAVTVAADGDDLTVTVPDLPADSPEFTGPITIDRTGASNIVSSFSPTYVEALVTSIGDDVNPIDAPSGVVQAFAAGYSTNLPNGTLLYIYGYGLSSSDRVLFGPQLTPPQGYNALEQVFSSSTGQNMPGTSAPSTPAQWLATCGVYGTAPNYVSSDGTELEVYVPEDAVSGQVNVILPDGTDLPAPQDLQVFSFRNSFAFSILNGSDGITSDGANHELNGQTTNPDVWDDFGLTQALLEQEFPGALTNVVNYLTSEAQLAAWESSLNNNGSCFGVITTASLLYQAATQGINTDPTAFLGPTGTGAPKGINFSNPSYAPVFSLGWNSNITMNGVTLPLVQVIHLNLMAQMSEYVTASYEGQELNFRAGNTGAQSFINEIAGELAAGRPPIISISPANHSVLAYGIQSDGQGGYYINVYNPNDPVDSVYTTSANTGQYPSLNSTAGLHDVYVSNSDTSGKPAQNTSVYYQIQTQAGMLAEDNQDRIHIDAQGIWYWYQDDGEFYSNSIANGGLQIFPVNINAVSHNTPFVGPAETMSLPNPGNDILLDGVLILGPVVAAEATEVVVTVIVTVLSFLDSSPPPHPVAQSAAVVPAPQVELVRDQVRHASHAAKTWWVGSASGSNFPTIQAAIDSAEVKNGDTLKVEPGAYADAALPGDTVTVSKSLTIIGGQAFPGSGHGGASVVTSDGVGFTLSAADVAIEDFTVHAAGMPLGVAGIATAPGFIGSAYQIRDDVIEGEASGLQLNTQGGRPSVVRVIRASIALPGGPAALLRGGARRHDAVRALFAHPVTMARKAGRSSASTTISGDTFADNIEGITSDVSMASVDISSDSFTGDSAASVAITGSSRSSGVQVMNNKVLNDSPIVLQDVSSSKVEGNNVVNPLGGGGDGIWLQGGVTGTLVQQNTLSGNAGTGNGVDVSGSGNSGDTIKGNTVTDFARGIRLNAAGGNTVLDNTVDRSAVVGIDLANGSSGNTVKGNNASGDAIGISMLVANGNTITKNTTEGASIAGIAALNGDGNTITKNQAISDPGAIGILINGSGNIVEKNTASGDAVGIGATLSTATRIEHNTASSNSMSGIEVQYDVNASGQSDQILNNTTTGNGGGGILAYMSTYVTVTHDKANGNTGFGIQLQNSGEADTYDTITRDTADDNSGGAGINLINDDSTTVTDDTTTGDGVAGIGTQDSNNDTITKNKT
jgi:parallel beta-helix repeat protein